MNRKMVGRLPRRKNWDNYDWSDRKAIITAEFEYYVRTQKGTEYVPIGESDINDFYEIGFLTSNIKNHLMEAIPLLKKMPMKEYFFTFNFYLIYRVNETDYRFYEGL